MRKKVRRRKNRNKHVEHREIQLLALALKLAKTYSIHRIMGTALELNIVLTEEELIAAEKYLKTIEDAIRIVSHYE